MRIIDADAYAAEMKIRQDACKEMMDAAIATDNWEMYDGLSRAYSIFTEASLTLRNTPTIDAVPVVRCRKCRKWDYVDQCCMKHLKTTRPDYFCADGERKDGEHE